MRRWMVLTIVVVLALLFAVAAVAFGAHQFENSGRIARGVTIEGISVAAQRPEEALEALHRQWVPTLPRQVTLAGPDEEWTATPEELGAKLPLKETVAEAQRVGRDGPWWQRWGSQLGLGRGADIEVVCGVDSTRVQRFLIELAPQVNREPKNAEINVEDDAVDVVPGVVGRSLDIAGSRAAIVAALRDPSARQIGLVVKTQHPALTEADLADLEVVLAQYSTKFNPGKVDRTHNLKLAVDILDRTIVQPGEQFSLNEVVGPRLTEKGYREAPIFVNGEIEPSTGGGVCQVASTVYNAALLADLKINERHHHSRPVDYAPAGRDATVYYGQLDLKLTNTLQHPIMALGTIEGNRLTVTIIGSQEDDVEVELIQTGYVRLPNQEKEFVDPSLAPGTEKVERKGHAGARATLIRRVTKNGEVIREETLHRDVYRPQTKIVKVGPPEQAESPGADGSARPIPGILRAEPGTARRIPSPGDG